MTLWELKTVYAMIRKYGYESPMLDVGGVFSTTLADYNPARIIETASGHIWSDIDRNCISTHEVEDDVDGSLYGTNDRYGTIVSTSTLEHCDAPFSFIDCCMRLLKPGGLLILTTPFMWPYHGSPGGDRWRFSEDGLKILCEMSDLNAIESGRHQITDDRSMSFVVASKGDILNDRDPSDAQPPISESELDV